MSQTPDSTPDSQAASAMAVKQRLATLSPEKLAALQKRLRQQCRSSYEPIRTRRDEPVYPLALNQRRLWFIEQLQPGTPLYNVTRAFRLRGPLDVDALRLALRGLVDQHEALRTTFEMHDGEPAQRINEPTEVSFSQIDLQPSSKDEDVPESVLRGRLTAEGRRVFDLSADLMLRTVLYRLADDEHVLQITIHHLACDGWSLRLLLGDLANLYRGFCSGQTVSLKPTGTRYVDFACRQQEPKQQDRFDECVQWWSRQLAGAPQVLELPTDRPRPKMESGSGAFQPFDIPVELTNQLESFGKEEGATLFMTLLTGFFILLHRYTGMEDFLVGTPIAGRHHPESENLVGFFVDTIVLRADLSGEPTARQLLRRVRQTVIDALGHADVPLERIVESIGPSKDLSRPPLFQVLFNAPPTFSAELDGLDVSPIHIDLETSRFDLTMTWSGSHDRPTGATWNTDLFDADTIARLLGHYRVLLEAIARVPDQPVHQLPLLTKEERHQLLVEWNETTAEHPSGKCVHELFEHQVEQAPTSIAAVFQNQQITYEVLNRRANQLAHWLIQSGIAPQSLVGICIEPSLEMLVAVLGILKAGCAYVPIDGNFPRDRIAFVLRDAGLRTVLTRDDVPDKLSGLDVRCVGLNFDRQFVDSEPTANPLARTNTDAPIYVLYTSGSTGRPKGVVVTHRNVCNYLFWLREQLLAERVDVMPLTTSLSFDAVLKQLLGPLLMGLAVHIVPEDDRYHPQRLLRQLCLHPRTAFNGVPSLWQAILSIVESAPADVRLRHLTHVILGGEPISQSLARRTFAALPHVRIWNLYGPTETTANSTAAKITSGTPVTIGKPLANTRAYLLDQSRQLVPVGVPGELYIGGDGVAQGYLNRPELTAERFGDNRFDEDPESRLYRTGDLCRWRADGNLEFLGRLDHQVKLRGFRIELGEIEAVLEEHAQVAQSVVTVREDRPGDRRLVAYCVPVARGTIDLSLLRSHLQARIPDYMIPSAFVSLDALPLTPSGKVDRHKLPTPDDSRPDLETSYVAARTPLEEQLVAIWQEVLGLERVGVHDDFFAMGGHSLLATRMNARIAAICQVDLPLRRLFEAPTIGELAVEIETLRCGAPSTRDASLVPIDRDQIDQLPLSFAQQRLWFLEQLEGELTAYNMSMAWRLDGTLDVESLRRALETIVRRHEPLRTTFVMTGADPMQRINAIDRFNLPVEDLAGLEAKKRESEIARHRRLEAERPFDLTSDLMLRASLLRLSDDQHVLLLTMHHIASDGWSLGVLRRELSECYAACCRGAKPQVPKLPVQYADYAMWQRRELQGQRLDALLAYWREQLDGVSELELPTDRPRPLALSYQGARLAFELSEKLVEGLKSLGRAEGATLHMILLAAFQTLLARYGGQDDIAVGTPIAGRNHRDLEEQIGFFVNTLVLRTDFSGAPTFREVLKRVRKVSLAAFDHQDLPFEKLVEDLQPERHLSRSPLFQALFQLTDFSNKDLSLGDLAVARLPSSTQRARFDLEMTLRQQAKTIRGDLVYSTDLFDHSTIERMVGHFLKLLEGVAVNPDQRFDELPLLSAPERQQLLVEWNDTNVDYPNKCVHQLFEEQVTRTPEAVAVVLEDQQLTYRELNERANRLAHHLRSLGVGPDVLVGIYVEQSLEMAIAVLGVLKAGGAYTPLSRSYPRERLRLMLEDAQVPVLLCPESLEAELPRHQAQVVHLDAGCTEIHSRSHENPQPTASLENLVYVLYTSGSTGRPKGVAFLHRGGVNLIRWQLRNERARRGLRALLFSPLSFDASFTDMFMTWCSGGTLVMATDEMRLDPAQLADLLAREAVERINLPFVALQSLASCVVGRGESMVFPALKQVFSTAEQLHITPDIREWLQANPDVELENQYGPTETHVVTGMPLQGSADTWPNAPSIGKPIANTSIYVLDQHLTPVPVGVVGHLYIAGDGLARGYLNCPELTAERFVDNPFDGNPESRLYRTGDLCRWRANGNLEFLGRLDHQIKLRGFRIEPGEIEDALRAIPQVSEAVVVAREDDGRGKRLVAYVIAEQTDPPTAECLRESLRATLPDYMVPSAFVLLDALPLNPNGKVDRRALPAPEFDRSELGGEFIAPRTPREEAVAKVWQEVLLLDEMPGVADNFFELGGHSLLSASLVARIEKSLKVKVPLRKFFENPTIAGLAQAIEAEQEDAGPAVNAGAVDTAVHQPLLDRPSEGSISIWHHVHRGLARFATRTTRSVKKRLPWKKLFDPSTISNHGVGGKLGTTNAKVAVDADADDGESTFRWPLPEELDRSLRSYVGSWRGERASSHSLIVGRNTGGSKPPLFWVFQGAREFSQLAHYLGPDQPLYGMRSGHLIMRYEEDNIQAFALRYAEEIMAVRPEGPICIGGNCQGGLIALALAQHLLRRQRTVPLLVLLEWPGHTQPYPEPVAILFGAESAVANPWLRGFRHPELAWQRVFPKHRMEVILGEHGQFFNEPNVQSLASTLERCLAEAAVQPPALLPRGERREAIEVLNFPETLLTDQHDVILVKLTNIGSVAWSSVETSGLMLGNRWLDADGNVLHMQDGRAPLPALAPGETAKLSLPVRAPALPGRVELVLGLVEEGVSWSSDAEGGGARHSVDVVESPKVSVPNLPGTIAGHGPPIVIGGTGGSGSRVISHALGMAGVFLGNDLNRASDSLGMIGSWWNHVLPYWRRSIPSATEAMIRQELWETVQDFLSPLGGEATSQPWGWKLPPTVFVTPFLHQIWPDLRCVHLIRDGRDMAFSAHQNQLRRLGPIVLESDELILPTPERSIRLWDRLNTALAEYAERHLADRYLQLRYEDLCAEPIAMIARLLSFLEIEGDARKLAEHVSPPASLGRWRKEPEELVERLTELARTGLDRFGYHASSPQDESRYPQPVVTKSSHLGDSAYRKAS